MKSYLIAISLLMGLTGCGNDTPKETFKTVSFYEKNKDIREARITECKNMKEMTATIEKDCKNANSASRTPALGGEMQRAHNKTY